jgi:hypothetical protein
MLGQDSVDSALAMLGFLLTARGFAFEIVVVGGSALLLLGIIDRPSADLDVLAIVQDRRYESARPLPPTLVDAARDVARVHGLAKDWLNSGPTAQLVTGLPVEFASTRATISHWSSTLPAASIRSTSSYSPPSIISRVAADITTICFVSGQPPTSWTQ